MSFMISFILNMLRNIGDSINNKTKIAICGVSCFNISKEKVLKKYIIVAINITKNIQ